MRRITISLVLIVISSLFLLATEEKSIQQEKKKEKDKRLHHHVLVTATRTEQPAMQVASSASIITGYQLQVRKSPTISAALTQVPGLDVAESGGLGKEASIFIRGANSEHTLVMVDGVEMNDPMSPGRSYDLAHLVISNIERIEVVRGPQSTLYGSDALGGVIHVFTKKGMGKPRLNVSFEGGSYQTFHEKVGFSGGDQTMNYSLAVSRLDSAGFSASHQMYGNHEKDGYSNTSLSANIGLQPAQGFTLQFTGRYIDGRSELDSGAGAGGDDPNYIFKNHQLIVSSVARLKLLKNRWQQKLTLSYNNIGNDYENGRDEFHPEDSSSGQYRGSIFQFDWQHDLRFLPGQTLTAGMEFEREGGESEYVYESAWGPGESLFPRKSAANTGIYLQDDVRLGQTLFVTLGIRSDIHSRFGNAFTYRVAPGVVFKSGTRLKASIGSGFKAPSLYQLYAPATAWGAVGNLHLEPEKSVGWDAGIEQTFLKDTMIVSVVYFSNRFEQMIQYDWQKGFINIAKATSRGLELSLSYDNFRGFGIQGNYTYTQTEDLETGEALLRRPKHKASLNIHHRLGQKVSANLALHYVGQRIDIYPYPDRAIADPYTLVNLILAYDLSAKIQVYLRMNNLLDHEYEAVLGYGTAGRSAYFGFRATI